MQDAVDNLAMVKAAPQTLTKVGSLNETGPSDVILQHILEGLEALHLDLQQTRAVVLHELAMIDGAICVMLRGISDVPAQGRRLGTTVHLARQDQSRRETTSDQLCKSDAGCTGEYRQGWWRCANCARYATYSWSGGPKWF